jgi:starch phosphorylase
MKAGINGVINLSVLDGWWDEGYDGKNGWAIKPVSESFDEGRRTREEAKTLYELLQDHVIPMYYKRSDMGFSHEWIAMAKHSIATLLPRFSSTRMVGEYLSKFYLPATRQGRKFTDSKFAAAKKLAAWKEQVRSRWRSVRVRRLDSARRNIAYGDSLRFEVAVFLDGLKPEDVVVELQLGRHTDLEKLRENHRYRFEWEGVMTEEGEHRFVLQVTPEMCGKLEYRIRVYPWHELLTHPFEMGMMQWL